MRQHRARRRGPTDSNALEFDFPAPEPQSPTQAEDTWPAWEGRETSPSAAQSQSEEGPYVPPKIIRFPVAPFSRLATEEILLEETPTRILEAGPEAEAPPAGPVPASAPAQQMELPCFDDIHLDAGAHKPFEIAEPVPQPAPLGRRALAAAADSVIVLFAWLAFKISFTYLAEDEPVSKAALLCALAIAGALWLLYQYLFLVHGERTPGMVLTDLELSTFAGHAVGRSGRKLRVLAGAVSGFSLGLGFAWALVDEDQLGWHDRMTGTVVRSRIRTAELA
ncbi:MAG TPA: RDD family protein [Candidatus Angelobacter sp.]